MAAKKRLTQQQTRDNPEEKLPPELTLNLGVAVPEPAGQQQLQLPVVLVLVLCLFSA